MQLQIKATKPQAEFMTMPEKYRLFCAGYGSGKSEAMANCAMIDACQSSDAIIACYAPTYDLVRLITAPRIQTKLIDHGIPHKYNKQENVIYTGSPHWGDFILRTLDNPERIVGYESYTAHVDELDTLKMEHAKDAWNKIIGRNRQRPSGIDQPFNQASAYTTPEGFKFAHWRWVVEAGPDYGMVQAPSYSNPFLPPDYIQSLRDSYPGPLVDAYIEGRFVNLTAGTVYSAYDRERCRSTEVIRRAGKDEFNRDIPPDDLYIGQDFNVGKMASTVYVKRPNGWNAVDELTDVFDTPAFIEILKSRYAGHKIIIYPDASGASRKTVDASKSDISLLERAGFSVRAPKKNPIVKDRILAVNNAFANGKLWVNDKTCPNTARSLEQQAYDKNGEPDKNSGDDHQNDATGYPIAYEMPIHKPVSSANIRFSM